MDRGQVDALLKGYQENKGRCSYLRTMVRALERQIDEAEKEARDDILFGSHFAMAEKPSTGELVVLPKGNMTGDPTGNAAIRLADGASKETRALKIQLSDTLRELSIASEKVQCVEAWLEGLGERERWIIEEHTIKEHFWSTVMDGYADRYGAEFSKEALKRIKANAMEKIYRMAA